MSQENKIILSDPPKWDPTWGSDPLAGWIDFFFDKVKDPEELKKMSLSEIHQGVMLPYFSDGKLRYIRAVAMEIAERKGIIIPRRGNVHIKAEYLAFITGNVDSVKVKN